MKTYFAINGDYRIDYGLEYAVLYWFTENEQYILDKLHKIAFELIEKQNCYQEICDHLGKKETDLVISDFSNFNLISEVDVPQGREIARHGTLYMSKNHQMLGLRHLFIPLPFSCGKKCDFCHSDSMIGCFSCIGSTSSWNYDYLNMLNNIVKFVNEKGCSTIILKGGDPLLFFDKTKEILSIIRKTYSGSIILITTSEPNTVQKEVLSSLLVDICVNIEFNDYIKKLSNNKIDKDMQYNININESQINELNSIGSWHPGLSLTIYSSDKIQIDHSTVMQFQRQHVSNEIYSYFQSFHPCLNGCGAIDLDGDILPCPSFSKNSIKNNYPNIKDDFINLSYLADYWTKPQRNLHRCNNCENRSYCFDCRAYEELNAGFEPNNVGSCTK